MKTSSELIIKTLLSGSELRTPEIQNMLAAAGHKMELSNVASLLRVLSDQDKSNIGYFLNRRRTKKGFAYKIVEEALELSPEELYGLIRKIGKNSFSLNQAIKKIPGLKKYIQSPEKKSIPKITGKDTKENAVEQLIKDVILQGGLNFNISCQVQLELPDRFKD
jgi:hypothetical protein